MRIRVQLCADDPQNSPRSSAPEYTVGRWGGRFHHHPTIITHWLAGRGCGGMENEVGTSVVWQCRQYGYMGTAPYVVSEHFALFWKQTSYRPVTPVSYLPPMRTVQYALTTRACIHHEARGQVVVAIGRLSVYLSDRQLRWIILNDAAEIPFFSTSPPRPFKLQDFVRMDFGEATSFLFPRVPR